MTALVPGDGVDEVLSGGDSGRGKARRRLGVLPTAVLLVGALYCLLPVVWLLVAATKTPEELFSTFSFAPSFNGGFTDGLSELFGYGDALYLRWVFNSLLFSGGGALLSVCVSAAAGYALAKYEFRGREAIFATLLGAVLVPQITLAIPQYLLLAKVGLAGSYWSVLLPSILSPYGIFLARIYASAAVPTELMESARIDGASEFRVFRSIAVPIMMPGLVTVFLLQFVAIWNNFLLPFIMLSDDGKFPLTVGIFSMLNRGATQPVLFGLAIMASLLSVIPIIALFLSLQRYWRIDLVSGGVKG